MYERWAVLFLGVTGGVLILWGLIILPAPVALIISGFLLTGAAAVLHLRSSPPPPVHPQLPSAMAAFLALLRGSAPVGDEPEDPGAREVPGVPAGNEPPAQAEARTEPGSQGEDAEALAKVQEAAGERSGPRHRGHPSWYGRRPVVRATATTYQEGGQTATHKLRVRIGGRRAP